MRGRAAGERDRGLHPRGVPGRRALALAGDPRRDADARGARPPVRHRRLGERPERLRGRGAARPHPGLGRTARCARGARRRRRRRPRLVRVRARPAAAGLRLARSACGAPATGRCRRSPTRATTTATTCCRAPRSATGCRETEHAMYLRGLAVEPADRRRGARRSRRAVLRPHLGALLLAPADALVGARAGRRRSCAGERSVYFAHPVFTQYDTNAPRWCKTLVANALALLLPEPLVTHDGPSTLRVSVTEQPDERRWVVHLLHYIPERRGRQLRHDRGRHPPARPDRLRPRAGRGPGRHARARRRRGRRTRRATGAWRSGSRGWTATA